MGQYFKLVNVTKKEYINPYCCNDLAKFAEAITGNMGNLLLYMMRKSDGGGGGDIPILEEMQGCLKHALEDIAKAKCENDQKSIDWWGKYAERYRKEIAYAKRIKFAGRWVGDYVILVGDYDSSKLYSEAVAAYDNITHHVMEEYNEFIGEDYGIYCEESHVCEKYKSKQNRRELYDRIPSTLEAIKRGVYHPESMGYEEIEQTKDAIAIVEAEDEYYGKYKEPKWKFQVPKSRQVEHKGKMAPDMILSSGGNK